MIVEPVLAGLKALVAARCYRNGIANTYDANHGLPQIEMVYAAELAVRGYFDCLIGISPAIE